MVSLVGLFVVSALGVALVTTSLNRISESTDSLTHLRIMSDYGGRPEPVADTDGVAALNYLVLASSNRSLRSAVVVNLSASRRSLTLITMSADLTVATNPNQTLKSSFAIDPATTVRALETYTSTRMDHQIVLDLDSFGTAIDDLGGIKLGNTELDGAAAIKRVLAATDSDEAAIATGAVIKAVLVAADQNTNALDPFRSSRLINTLTPCVEVDTGLTGSTVRTVLLESSVHPEEIRIWPQSQQSQTATSLIDQDARQALRTALSSPNLTETAQYQEDAFLPEETNR